MEFGHFNIYFMTSITHSDFKNEAQTTLQHLVCITDTTASLSCPYGLKWLYLMPQNWPHCIHIFLKSLECNILTPTHWKEQLKSTSSRVLSSCYHWMEPALHEPTSCSLGLSPHLNRKYNILRLKHFQKHQLPPPSSPALLCGAEDDIQGLDQNLPVKIFLSICQRGRRGRLRKRSRGEEGSSGCSYTNKLEMANPDPFTDSESSESVIEEIRIIRVLWVICF